MQKKDEGKPNVKNLEAFNTEFVKKWELCFLHDPHAIWKQILEYKYGPLTSKITNKSKIIFRCKRLCMVERYNVK